VLLCLFITIQQALCTSTDGMLREGKINASKDLWLLKYKLALEFLFVVKDLLHFLFII